MGNFSRKLQTAYRDSHGIDDNYRARSAKTSRIKKNKTSKKKDPKLILRLKLASNLKAVALDSKGSKVNVEGDIFPLAIPNPPVAPIVKKIFDQTPLHPMEYGPHEQPETEPFPTIDLSLGEAYTESHCALHCEHHHCVRIAHRQKHAEYYHGTPTIEANCTCNKESSKMTKVVSHGDDQIAHDWRQLADDEIFVIRDEAIQIINEIKRSTSFLHVGKLYDSREFARFRNRQDRNIAARAARDYCFEEIETFFELSTSEFKNFSFVDTPENLKHRVIACLGLKLCEYIKQCTPLDCWPYMDRTFSVTAGLASGMVLDSPLARQIWIGWIDVLDEFIERLINAQKLRVIEAAMMEALILPKGTKRKMDEVCKQSSNFYTPSKRGKKVANGSLSPRNNS